MRNIFFELMNNSLFGTTMENLRKRISFKLINNSKDYFRCLIKAIHKIGKEFMKLMKNL